MQDLSVLIFFMRSQGRGHLVKSKLFVSTLVTEPVYIMITGRRKNKEMMKVKSCFQLQREMVTQK